MNEHNSAKRVACSDVAPGEIRALEGVLYAQAIENAQSLNAGENTRHRLRLDITPFREAVWRIEDDAEND